jgi:ABC-2 type transport system permease protein
MASTSPEKALHVIAPRRTVVEHLRELSTYRELFVSLVRKELKVRYKQSTLGLLWSMIQPVFLLVIYSVVFSVLGAGFADFGIWLLCGLLVWGFVSTSITSATNSIVTNGQLVGKVRFPRAVLPGAAVGASAVHFMLQLGTFAIVLAVARHRVDWRFVPLLPIATLALLVVLTALGLLLAAANVYARDTEHLLEFAVQGWFWLTPIVYTFGRFEGGVVSRSLPAWIPLLNPFTPVVITFQRALYGRATADGEALIPDLGTAWYLRNLLALIAAGLLSVYVALRVFDRAEADMAEML